MDLLSSIFGADGFMPHGNCYLWRPGVLWLHVISDLLIGLAYLSIPATLIFFIRKRRDVPFNWMFVAFGVFILACGATHFMSVWTTWDPVYWLSGMVKAITAVASIATALLLVRLVPQALLIPSVEQMEGVNAELKLEIGERKRIENVLHERNMELQEAATAKNRFLANISHELRTPLNAIIGFTGTMLMKLPGPLTTEQDKQLTIVRNSARHLLSLINDLLDVAKIESGKVQLNPELRSCLRIVEEVVTSLRPLAEKKGLGLEVHLPAEDVPIRIDPRAFAQIAINLVNNAIKFTESGRVTITLAQRTQPEGVITEFSVADTGCGIKPEDQSKLFQPFTQLDSSSTRRLEGTGLGLHLSQKLAELIGAHITVASEIGKGSTFMLSVKTERM